MICLSAGNRQQSCCGFFPETLFSLRCYLFILIVYYILPLPLGQTGSALLPGQTMKAPATNGAAVMVIIEFALEAFRNIVHLGKIVFYQ